MDRIATAIHFGHDNALSLKDRRPASCNKGRPSKALGAEEWGFDSEVNRTARPSLLSSVFPYQYPCSRRDTQDGRSAWVVASRLLWDDPSRWARSKRGTPGPGDTRLYVAPSRAPRERGRHDAPKRRAAPVSLSKRPADGLHNPCLGTWSMHRHNGTHQ